VARQDPIEKLSTS